MTRQTIWRPALLAAAAMPGAVGPSASAAEGEVLAAVAVAGEGNGGDIDGAAEVRSGTLPNGMRFRLARTDSADRSIYIGLSVDAGTFDEQPGQLGIAHLVEHVVALHGSRAVPGGGADLAAAGLTRSADYGALTGGTATTYWISVPDQHRTAFPLALRAVQGWSTNALFRKEDIDTERAAVIAELGLAGATPSFLADEAVRRRLLGSVCYNMAFAARHDENIRTADASVIRGFYTDWYRPERQTLVVVGPIDAAAVESDIRRLFADPGSAGTAPASARERCRPAFAGGRTFTVRAQPDLDMPRLRLTFKRPLGSPADGRAARRERMLDALLTHALGARAETLQKRYNSPFAMIALESDAEPMAAQFGTRLSGGLAAIVDPARVDAGIDMLVAALRDAGGAGFARSEFETASAMLRSDLDRPAARSSSAEIGGALLAGKAHGSDDRSSDVALLEALGPADLDAHAARLFALDADFDITLAAAPANLSAMPSEAELAARFDRIWSEPAARLAERPAPPVSLMSAEARAALADHPLRSKVYDAATGVTSVRLANGLDVRIRPDDSGATHGLRLTGVRRERRSGRDVAAATSAIAIALNGGAGGYDRFAVEDWAAAKGLTLGLGVERKRTLIEARGLGDDLVALLEWTRLALVAPRWSKEIHADWQAQAAADLRTDAASGREAVLAAEAEHFWGAGSRDMRARIVTPLTQDAARRQFDADFGKLSDFTFILTGAIDVDTAIPLVSRYLGDLPVGARTLHARAVPPPPDFAPRARRSVRFVGGAGPVAEVSVNVPGRLPDDLKTRVSLELLGAALDLRIFERIREREGAAYAPMASVFTLGEVERSGAGYIFNVRFKTKPARAEAMVAASFEEIARLRQGDFDTALIQRAIKQITARDPAASIAADWHDHLVMTSDRPPSPFRKEERQKILHALTLEELRAVAAVYLAPDHALDIVRTPGTEGEAG